MNSDIASVVVLGGHGKMGALFVKLCEEAGIEAIALDQPLVADTLTREVPRGDLVLMAVPIQVVDDVLAKVVPHMREGQILADICSVKVEPLRKMLRDWNGPTVGTHPLFGPNGPDEGERRVAVTEGRDENAAAAVSRLFERIGLEVFSTTAKVHDRVMAFIQGLNFVTTISYFSCTAGQEEIDAFLTPSFRRRLDAARKMVTEDAGLFETIFESNPFSQDAVRLFRSHLNVAAGGDVSLLAARANWWWEDDTDTGRNSS